jgi:putative flippase GtrA
VSALMRWCTFNAVGAAGLALQLGLVVLFTRLCGGRYLLASAAALELTLLHNFTWHLRYTWRDRKQPGRTTRRLLRFHLSNGLVSAAGSLLLLPVLVRWLGMAVVPANAAAVLCCSVVNFGLADRWAWADEATARSPVAGTSPGCEKTG